MPDRSKPPPKQPITPVRNRFSSLSNRPEETPEAGEKVDKKKKDRKRDRTASVRSEPPELKKETKEQKTATVRNESTPSSPVSSISTRSSSTENLSSISEDADEDPENHLPIRESLPAYRWKDERNKLDWCKIARGNGCPWTLKKYHAVMSRLYRGNKQQEFTEHFESYNSYLDPEMLCLYYLPGPCDRWGGLAISFLKQRIEKIKGPDLVDRDHPVSRRPKELIVLTGHGNRNKENRAVIKAARPKQL